MTEIDRVLCDFSRLWRKEGAKSGQRPCAPGRGGAGAPARQGWRAPARGAGSAVAPGSEARRGQQSAPARAPEVRAP